MSLLPNELDDERLIRYLRGECSRDELHAIEQWAAAEPAHRERLRVLERGWAAAGHDVARGDVDQGWMRIAAQLDAIDAPSTTASSETSRLLRIVPPSSQRSRWIAIARAAGVVLALGATSLLMWTNSRENISEQPGVIREIATRPGQRADVYLSDGTHVVLGVASRLRFPAAFGASRDVELHGQAYFEVADDDRPFAVHTARAVARDIGTKFDVRAYAAAEDVVVAVTEGAVILKPVASKKEVVDSVILKRSDVGVLSPDGTLVIRDDVDVGEYVAWTTGRLVFKNVLASVAVAQFNRWYGANVQLGDSALANLALTMSITDESLADATRILAHALDARIGTQDSTVVLHTRHTR